MEVPGVAALIQLRQHDPRQPTVVFPCGRVPSKKTKRVQEQRTVVFPCGVPSPFSLAIGTPPPANTKNKRRRSQVNIHIPLHLATIHLSPP